MRRWVREGRLGDDARGGFSLPLPRPCAKKHRGHPCCWDPHTRGPQTSSKRPTRPTPAGTHVRSTAELQVIKVVGLERTRGQVGHATCVRSLDSFTSHSAAQLCDARRCTSFLEYWPLALERTAPLRMPSCFPTTHQQHEHHFLRHAWPTAAMHTYTQVRLRMAVGGRILASLARSMAREAGLTQLLSCPPAEHERSVAALQVGADVSVLWALTACG